MTHILKDFPLSPSANQLYKNRRGGRCKTDIYKEFLGECDIWSLTRRRKLEQIHKHFMKEIHNVKWIQVSMYVHLEPAKMYTKGGKLKKIDVSNRVKAAHDVLSDFIEIDDKYFCLGNTEFILSDVNKITFVLKSKSQMTNKDLKDELKKIGQD